MTLLNADIEEKIRKSKNSYEYDRVIAALAMPAVFGAVIKPIFIMWIAISMAITYYCFDKSNFASFIFLAVLGGFYLTVSLLCWIILKIVKPNRKRRFIATY